MLELEVAGVTAGRGRLEARDDQPKLRAIERVAIEIETHGARGVDGRTARASGSAAEGAAAGEEAEAAAGPGLATLNAPVASRKL